MKFLDELNPFFKCVSVVLSCILLSFTFSIQLNVAMFIISFVLLVFFSNAKIKNILLFLIPVSIASMGLFFTGAIFGTQETTEYSIGIVANMGITSIQNGLQLATRVLAFCGVGMLFTLTTKPVDFVHSLMQQGKLKPKFAYGILASINLMPNIKREYENARFALEIRGINCTVFSVKPLFTMFVNAIFWADCLTMAMESKGFNIDANRCFYEKIQVRFIDYVFLVIPQVMIIIYIIENICFYNVQ